MRDKRIGVMLRLQTFFLLAICLSCSTVLGGEGDSIRQRQDNRPVYVLEGTLNIHPKYLYKYYLTHLSGKGYLCALFGEEKLKDIKLGSRIHVEGHLGTRFHGGGSEKNPSPFPRRWFIYMEVQTVKVLQEKRTKKPQFKGIELYSYVDDGNTIRYALLIGTNRIKSVDEIVRYSISYRELIKKIGSLAPNENIIWVDNRPENILLKYPDKATIGKIKSICKELDIKLHFMTDKKLRK